jgi:hypothetical protein
MYHRHTVLTIEHEVISLAMFHTLEGGHITSLLLEGEHWYLYTHLYFDDFIDDGSLEDATFSFLRDLQSEFAIKDLGDLHYYLGIEVNKSIVDFI